MATEFIAPAARKITLKTSTGEVELTEPYPGASIEEIRAFNQSKYPQLATCGVDTAEESYTFKDASNNDVNAKRENINYKPNVGTRG